MRATFIKTVTELAHQDKRIMLLTGDLGFTVFEEFQSQFPDRYINVGVAEQNMMSISAGLALTGKIVFAYSIGTFATMRPFEQIRNDIASHSAHVIVVGTGGGLSYGDASITHHSMEDFALMRVIPGMRVLAPADPFEAEWATRTLVTIPGPGYLRLGKQKDQLLYSKTPKLIIGRGSMLTKGKDVLIIATGNIVATALESVHILSKKNITATLVSMHTIKPVDTRYLQNLLRNYSLIVTVEEHNIIGGLGSMVAESLTDIGHHASLMRLGIPDQFVFTIGSQKYLRHEVGLSPKKIAQAISRRLITSHG